jgi:ubiquinone biosynthesis protein
MPDAVPSDVGAARSGPPLAPPPAVEAGVAVPEDETAAPATFETAPSARPQGLVRRALTTQRHLAGLALGGLVARVRARQAEGGAAPVGWRLAAALARPFVARDLVDLPFPLQLRRRLERLGPTYIKLGQILSLREDVLPRTVTDELKHLLSRLPAVPFDEIAAVIEDDLGRPLAAMFSWVDERPIGSASIGQTHRARTIHGDPVILKVLKPGTRQVLERDAVLLRVLGAVLQVGLARYQPRRIIGEFVDYTLREVDLRREADNAETFAANFKDEPDIVFPAIHREFSGRTVLCMEFLDGVAPDAPQAAALDQAERERLVDLGASAIIRMLYRDGFFHADLHPGNLMVLPGPRCGFIDLGMVGRLDEELRRTLLYYYFALVTGDADNAARYLTSVAEPGPGGDPQGFRRDVAEISRRWKRAATFDEFSLGQLILESVARGGQYRMYFPVELVLMVKALVTFEGVGNVLLPGFDVAEVSKKHIRRLFLAQFSPLRLVQEGVRGAPDLIDAAVKLPLLMTEGLRVLEHTARRSQQNPLAGMRASVMGGFCIVGGAIVVGFRGPAWLAALLFLAGLGLALRRGG